ncbi:MAG: cobalamin B12-binding domain-containing protein [Chromatiales bacterium]|jgi:methanogenic corrinoid protein MtbC1|nr:cobalamin B12-binding domain-containing protein [Chromatiales bacterium]
MAGLVNAIEGEIIPRLMLVHRVRLDGPEGPTGSRRPGPDDVDTLTGLLLAREAGPAFASVEALMLRGVPLEAVYLDLIAPAARRLGALWDDDQVDFLQVTLGLCRLQQIVQGLGPACSIDAPAPPSSRALLASLAGDHHTLGLRLVGDLLRRRGWAATDLPAAPADEIVAAVRREAFDLLGLSVACDAGIGHAASIIAAARRVSRNPAIRVLVGGPAFAGQPARATEVGADATARDGLEAVARARELLAAGARPVC